MTSLVLRRIVYASPLAFQNSFTLAKKLSASGWQPASLAALELAQHSFCFLRQLDRGFHRDLDIEIAGHPAAAQHRHALAAQAELAARLACLRGS